MIEVRPLSAGDVPAVHSLLGDPAVAVWLRRAGLSQPFTLDECEMFVRAQVGHWTAHGFGCSLAWNGAQCVAWGLLQHCIVAGASEVEIGWTVASARWGEGIATRMGQYALAGAASLGLDTVIAYARVDNAASLRVIEKLGLAYEREFEHAAPARALPPDGRHVWLMGHKATLVAALDVNVDSPTLIGAESTFTAVEGASVRK